MEVRLNNQPITFGEIDRALESVELETRGQKSNENWTAEEHADRESHVLRIAYLVKHRDDTPIRLAGTGEVGDGWHRLMAAIYRGDRSILGE